MTLKKDFESFAGFLFVMACLIFLTGFFVGYSAGRYFTEKKYIQNQLSSEVIVPSQNLDCCNCDLCNKD
jgi:cbb3-type cytochrome oxidase subunit 3